MSKFKTVYMVYYISRVMQRGTSSSFDTCEEATWYSKQFLTPEWESHVVEQTYELEEDSHHDCGDDE